MNEFDDDHVPWVADHHESANNIKSTDAHCIKIHTTVVLENRSCFLMADVGHQKSIHRNYCNEVVGYYENSSVSELKA